MCEKIINYFPARIKKILDKTGLDFNREVLEIRLRVNQPLHLITYNDDFFVSLKGDKTSLAENCFLVEQKDIQQALLILTENSLYAVERQLKEGFITIKGGHRVGFTGEAVMKGGKLKTINNINSLNYRLSREVIGSAAGVLAGVYNGKLKRIYNTLIISPPLCGKTTILRDLVRIISTGCKKTGIKGFKTAVVDERSEIAGAYRGIAQSNIGLRTDLLDNCPKAAGMMLLIRSMSPEVIAVDEIGSREDMIAIREAVNAGVNLISTIHGRNLEEISCRPGMEKLFAEKVFKRFIILADKKGAGIIKKILDENKREVI